MPLSDHPEVRLSIELANQQVAQADREAIEAQFWPTYLQTTWLRRDNASNDQFLVELGIPLFGRDDEQANLAFGEAQILNARAEWVAAQVKGQVKMARAALTSREAQVKSARGNLTSTTDKREVGNPIEQARLKRIERNLELDIKRLELLVERAKIQLKLSLAQP